MIDSFRTECIQIGTSVSNKNEVIKEISALAKKSDILNEISAGEIEKSLLEREELVSTGLSEGIAIPHCSFEGIDRFVVGLLILKEGLDFEALDGEDSKLFFFMVGPKSARNKHIKILSSISKISKDKDLLKRLIQSGTESEVADILIREEEGDIPVSKVEKSQFVIHVQNEELFYDVLEILSSEVEGAVSVLDASTAGSYLHRLPLFSSFWNEKINQFSKIIITVIDKRLMNDTIRRLNMVLPEDGRGIIISVSDILYFDGSIDF